ncbi:MAG: cadmium-translocating P-type ATPase [Rhodospirillaceae bacterium]|nr:cadmium-translocating P-type ATPase [Rhodospirillaceae bacterium]
MNELARNFSAFVETGDNQTERINLMVENVSCAGCIGKIERTLTAQPGVVSARVNMSTRRLAVQWRTGEAEPGALIDTVEDLGYPVAPFIAESVAPLSAVRDKELLKALAVAGFAAANVMLLSVAIWAGHSQGPNEGMGDATRTLFHWISALIALPAIAYAGRPFFRSAVTALRARALNMDVPISLAVVLSAGMSLQQTMVGGTHAYFDASITLLFFLLVGRYLDSRARAKARSTAEHLLALSAVSATVIDADGTLIGLPVNQVQPGMIILVAAGARVPLDGDVTDGLSEVDASLVTGETLPKSIVPGSKVFAGTLNVGAPFRFKVTAAGDNTLLAEIVRLMEAAEQGRAKYVRLADRFARAYAPVVHILALATFLGWFVVVGEGWQPSLMVAISVLIITCPCALGLAVPVVQVVAGGLLLRKGVLLKAADGLERLAQVDTVVFDKTGTLTRGRPELVSDGEWTEQDLEIASALAQHSSHPLSKAIAETASSTEASDVEEVPGQGLRGIVNGKEIRLGRWDWCGVEASQSGEMELWLKVGGRSPIRFTFSDQLRADAVRTISALQSRGLDVRILSGDRASVVGPLAEQLGVKDWKAECLPAEKVTELEALKSQGHRVVMVGDGLNDAPALSAGFVSISPASAADVSQTAADFIFQGEGLGPVVTVLRTAKAANRLVIQNFGLALAYNAVAVPLAVAGLVTPLIAAVAMSASSVTVTLNALRLRLMA